MSNDRAKFGSRFGLILATAGSAVGLGNIWRFPYMTGNNGGAAFILVYIGCVLLLILGLPCVFGYNIWSNVHLIGGRDILDTEDFIVSNLLLPIGSLVYLLFCVSKWGWGFDNYIEEVNTGSGLKMSRKLKPYFQFVLPVLILIILIQGLL